MGLRTNSIAASRTCASLPFREDAEGKRSSISFRAISMASLAIWLRSLPGLICSEHFLPGFVAGLQLPGVEFQCRQELAALAELVVHLRLLLQQAVNDRLVLHGDLLQVEC